MNESKRNLINKQFMNPTFDRWKYKHICFFYSTSVDSWINKKLSKKCKILYHKYVKYIIDNTSTNDDILYLFFLLSTSSIISDDLGNIARDKFFNILLKKMGTQAPEDHKERLKDISFGAKLSTNRFIL